MSGFDSYRLHPAPVVYWHRHLSVEEEIGVRFSVGALDRQSQLVQRQDAALLRRSWEFESLAGSCTCAAGVGGLPVGLICRRFVVRFHGRVLVLAPSANRPGRRPLKAEIGVRLPVELLTHSGRGVQRLAPLLREQEAEVRILPARP